MCLPEPSNICLMLLGWMSPKGSNTHARSPLQKKTSKYTCQAVWQENIVKELEKQGATQNSHWWQCGVDYLLPDYLKHLQDLKTRSLLPGWDYTTTNTRLFSRHTPAKWILYHPSQVSSQPCSAALPPIRCVHKKVKQYLPLSSKKYPFLDIAAGGDSGEDRKKRNMRIIKMLNVFSFPQKTSPKILQASDSPECGKCNLLLIDVIVFTRTFLYSHRQYLEKKPQTFWAGTTKKQD